MNFRVEARRNGRLIRRRFVIADDSEEAIDTYLKNFRSRGGVRHVWSREEGERVLKELPPLIRDRDGLIDISGSTVKASEWTEPVPPLTRLDLGPDEPEQPKTHSVREV